MCLRAARHVHILSPLASGSVPATVMGCHCQREMDGTMRKSSCTGQALVMSCTRGERQRQPERSASSSLAVYLP